MQDFTRWEIIGEGDERVCYLNPEDPTRCIKVSHKSRCKQSKREIRYFQYLVKRKVDFVYIPKFYRVIETEDYLGIEQERMINESGSQPLNLYYYLQQQLSPKQELHFVLALDELKQYFISNNIIPCDLVMSNMLVVEKKNCIKVVMIDGFGGAELIPLSNYFSWLGRKKIERKWSDFLEKRLFSQFPNLQHVK